MSAVFFDELEIPHPQYNLGIGSGPHGEQTGRQLAAIEQVLIKEKPDWILVYGDTNSTLAGALAAAKLNLPIAHVEAGLRSFNRLMPEEINRVLTDHCSRLLFAPTEAAVLNLEREGISGSGVAFVGDVMFDVALQFTGRARKQSTILERLGLRNRGFVLATIHRASNTDDMECLRTIVNALSQISEEVPVVFSVHPRTRSALDRLKDSTTGMGSTGQLKFVSPLGYLDMVALESAAAVVATDSGGVQKEAFFHQTPCVTLREETEWNELVEAGWNRLCPPETTEDVRKAVLGAIGRCGKEVHPYGDGNAAVKIARALMESSDPAV